VSRVLQALQEAGVRVQVYWRDQVTPGFKFNDWELRGVPLRVEVGPRDVDSGSVVAVRRDTREKQPVALEALGSRIPELLDEIQAGLFEQAQRFQTEHTTESSDWSDLSEILERSGGFVWVNWCDSEECIRRLAAEKATVRAIPLKDEEAHANGPCICCGNAAQFRCVVARSY
jgi:prolyl-tRNA synthetase